MGKTHLMSAIGNKMLKEKPGTMVLFASLEQFTRDFVSSVSHRTLHTFRDKYCRPNALLLDDIQYIKGKLHTLTELRHVIESLYRKGQQIVITSYLPPGNLRGHHADLEADLKLRLNGGLVIDIQRYNLNVKTVIAREKAISLNILLPSDVNKWIVSKAENIRQIEGCIIRLGAHSRIQGEPINMKFAKIVLRDNL